jgi:aminobenzoyl-glutamate transport protein
MIVAIIAVSIVLTIITEKVSVLTVAKYEYKDEKKEMRLGRREYRGLIFAIAAGTIYLLAILYNIIPGLPFSGNLLDHTQHFYIDKLFSYESFFSDGFVFVVMIFFVTLGLFYGIGAKTIKNNNDFCEDLTHSLDGTGRTLILIFLGSILVNVFKKTNIGTVIVVSLSNILKDSSFTGLPLVIILFFISAISTLFVTNPTAKWAIISTSAIPAFMNGSLSAEFAQLITRFGECATIGLTPMLAYFTIYIAYLEKYNQQEKPINFFKTLRYQAIYGLVIGAVLLLLLIGWYFIGIPIGIGGSVST